MDTLAAIFGVVMRWCYSLTGNYGLSIIVFTIFTKVVLMPVAVWVQKNSIKMVKMQPEINRIKARHFGDADAIAEEESKLYKREKYSALASLVPLVIQLVLLVGVVAVVRDPGTYILHAESEEAVRSLNMNFLGFDLTWVAAETGGRAILVPLIAAASSWALSFAQNAINVLQSEQSKWNKYGMMILSVGLSLYLGFFVAAGVALYWVASNLLAIVVQWLLNLAINPKKYVDYEELRASEQELAQVGGSGSKKRSFRDPLARRSRADYKRFFTVGNKHLVFYSESNGFYKYYAGIIEYLLKYTDIPIHYITSDPEDRIFEMEKTEPKIHGYYVEERNLIPLMMKMDADVVVMTMPDLETYQIKRSYVRKDVEYVNIPHGADSVNMMYRTGSLDHFDSILVCGKHQKEEIEKTEIAYGLPKKILVECGYPLLDDMRRDYAAGLKQSKDSAQNVDSEQGGAPAQSGNSAQKKSILIAPSWQKDNIVDSCLDEMLEQLRGRGYRITVRPHPQHVRHMPERMEQLKKRFEDDEDIEIQTDFSSNSTVFEADLLITDWSAISFEYAYTTLRPVLYVDTPMKVMNPEYQRIDTVPLNIWMRREIGMVVKPDHMEELPAAVETLLAQASQYKEKIGAFVDEYVYNPGTSAEVGARYLIGRIFRKAAFRLEEKKNGGSGKKESAGKGSGKAGKKVSAACAVLFFSAAALAATSRPVQAYIDPSVMTYAIQAIAGIVIALGAVFGIYWRRIRKRLDGVFHFEEKRYKETETDELCFDDPDNESGKIRTVDMRLSDEERAELRSTAENGIRTEAPAGKEKQVEKKPGHRFLPAVGLTLAAAFLTTVYSPAELYFSNIGDFWFDFVTMLPQMLKLFLLVAGFGLLVFFICFKIHRKLYKAVLALGLFGFLTMYVHGNFLAGHLPALDGTAVDWSLFRNDEVISIAVTVIILAVVILLTIRMKERGFLRVVQACVLVVTLLLAVSLISVCVKNDGLRKKHIYSVTDYGELEFSEDENFVILLLDAVDAQSFRDVWEKEPKYKDLFDDFTFFDNTLASYPFTLHSIPLILTGERMINQEEFGPFVTRAMENSELFRSLEERDYRMGVYETQLTYDSPGILRFENVRDSSEEKITDFMTYTYLETKLLVLKYAPYPVKKKGMVDMGLFENLRDREQLGLFSEINRFFYDKLEDQGITTTDSRCFRFIHLEGAHVPFKYDENVNIIDTDKGSYDLNNRACLTLTERFLRKMKEAGVYDNSVIVIMADHGYNDTRYGTNQLRGRQNPLLMIKGRGEKHDVQFDSAPISYEDLQTAWLRLLDGGGSEDAFDWKEGDERVRRYIIYEYEKEAHMVEYDQVGYAGDPDTLVENGNVYDE